MDLKEVKDSIANFVTPDQLEVLENEIDTKASQVSVDGIQEQLNGLASDVDVEQIKTELETKAEQIDVDSLKSEVEIIKNTATTNTALETVRTELQNEILLKADEFSVDGTTLEISEERVLSAKISNTVDWGGIKGSIENQSDLQVALNEKANNEDVDKVKIDLTNKAPNFTVDGVTVKMSEDRVISATGSGTSEWGAITGDITEQTDLNDILNDKLSTSQAVLFATKEDVQLKADKSDVDPIKQDVATLKTDKADNFKVDGITVLMSEDRVLSAPGGAPGGSTQWGNITGDITEQTDLKMSLDGKVSQAALDTTLANYAQKTEVRGKEDAFTVDTTTLNMSEDRVLSVIGGSDNSMVYTLPDDGILDVRKLDLTPGVKHYQIVKGVKDLAGFIQDDGTVFQGTSISRVGFYGEDALIYLDMGVNGDSPTNLDLYLSLKLDNLYNKRYELVWQMQVNKTTKEVVPPPENAIGLYKPKFNLSVEGSLSPTMSMNVPIGLTLVPPSTMMPADYWAPIYPSDYNKDVLSQLFLAPVNNSANSKERLNGKYAAVFTDGERSWAINDIDGDQIPSNPTWTEIVKSKSQLTKETQLTSPFE